MAAGILVMLSGSGGAMLKADDVIRRLGGVGVTARALGLPRTTVAGWQRGRGLVPSWHVERILVLLGERRVRLGRVSSAPSGPVEPDCVEVSRSEPGLARHSRRGN
jgi:hypothetical protein